MCSDTDNGSGGTAANKNDENEEPQEIDNTTVYSFIFEPATSESNTKSLTDAGVEAIANHKYKPGTYTFLDNKLSPIWASLTDLLPMWLAPNMVTLLGFLHCAFSFSVTWYYTPNFDRPVPDWVFLLMGYCAAAYYTLDCMDGKQARRTGQSSPLGQLFDHGFDCICTLSHISNNAAFLMIGGTPWFLGLQGSGFFAFFMAQWEEYYTGTLNHAVGNFGVTEVNYGVALFIMLNGFIDREAFWTGRVIDTVPTAISSILPSALLELQNRQFGLLGWFVVMVVLCTGSWLRVMSNDFVKTHNLQASAASTLLTPFLVAIAPFFLSSRILQNEIRSIMVSQGLLMSFLAMKMICFSMAKQSFATVQMEAFPFFGVIILLITDTSNHSLLNDIMIKYILRALVVWYAYRLIKWASSAIEQICKRLDIYCLSIKHPKTKAS